MSMEDNSLFTIQMAHQCYQMPHKEAGYIISVFQMAYDFPRGLL